MFELHNKKRYTGNRDSYNQFNSAGNVHSGSDMIGIEGYACQLSMSRRTIVKPMVEPQKDLKGATPESLAKALLHKRRAGERRCRRPSAGATGNDRPGGQPCPPFAPACLNPGCYACRQTHGHSGPDAWR